jgi:hypothetical protein
VPTGTVTTTHVSGGLTFSDVIPDRVHAKIGLAETGDANKVYKISNYNQAKNIFTKGELLDSLKQYFEEFDESLGQTPVPVLCIRPENDSAGSIATPVLNRTGNSASAAVGGTPTGTRTIKLKITKPGASGVAEYRKSLDGGVTYGTTLITPPSGSPIFLDVGVTVSFTNYATPEDSFQTGDVWTFEITGPGATNSARLAALEALKFEYDAYWIHILGESNLAFGVSVNALLNEFEDVHHPAFAILEGRKKSDPETIPEYFQSIQDEWEPFYSDRVSIVVAEGKYISGGVESAGGYEIVKSNTSLGEWRNAATMLTAKLAAGAPNISAAYVRLNRSLTFSEIRYWNEGYKDYMDSMYDMRLVVLKEYDDYPGIYIAGDKIKSHPDSDFVEIPERRRADKMHRIVYRASLPFLNGDTEINSGEGGIDYIKTVCDIAISSQMESQGKAEISAHNILLDPDKTFAATKILKAKLKMFVANRTKAIEWETSFRNAG